MSEKRTPFLMFFFLRIFIYSEQAHVSLLDDIVWCAIKGGV
jgi:hypothetical protein